MHYARVSPRGSGYALRKLYHRAAAQQHSAVFWNAIHDLWRTKLPNRDLRVRSTLLGKAFAQYRTAFTRVSRALPGLAM